MSITPSGRSRPFVLIVMDGWGINPRQEGNAIALARTPNIDTIASQWPHTAIKTSGAAVPNDIAGARDSTTKGYDGKIVDCAVICIVSIHPL